MARRRIIVENMEASTLSVLKTACVISSSVCGITDAWFEILDRWQTDEARNKTRQRYGDKWRVIRDSRVLELPERVIEWLLRTKKVIANYGRIWPELVDKFPLWLLVLYFMAGSFLFLWHFPFRNPEVGAGAYCLIAAGVLFLFSKNRVSIAISQFLVLLPFTFWGLAFTVNLPIFLATLAMFLCFPIVLYWVRFSFAPFGFGIEDLIGRRNETAKVLALSIAVSLWLTLCSLAVGHLASPEAWIPQTPQMIFSNVVLDGFTVLATFAILGRAVGNQRLYPIWIAVVLDAIVTAVFACASLWFGLLGTEHSLSINQVLYVLVGMSPTGSGLELGPYFWAMHTTFLPTLFYLAVIVICEVGKLVVLPVAKILQKGEELPRPHHLTAGLALFFVALFWGVKECIDLTIDVCPASAS